MRSVRQLGSLLSHGFLRQLGQACRYEPVASIAAIAIHVSTYMQHMCRLAHQQ